MNDSGHPQTTDWASFDWKNPDYDWVLRGRQERLDRLRRDPGLLLAVKDFYRDGHFVEFVRDWGMTRDPRVAADGRNPVFPFIPFPRQEELFHFFHNLIEGKERGVVDKTRDCGASWCAMSYSVWRFLFLPNNDIGFGSRKEELVDSKNDPKALFPKGRDFIRLLPVEFRPEGWEEKRHSPYLKFLNPENGSTIIGEAGDNIGRGGRTLAYFVDEHAYLDRPQLVEAALSENTNTEIDISTHNGTGTLFYKKIQNFPRERIFEFDWRDDPRKSQEWYDKKKSDPGTDPLIFAQEVDRDPSASVADSFIGEDAVRAAQEAGPADVIASGPFIVSVDVSAMGNDKSIINTRRGAINYEQKKFGKKEPDQLAVDVEEHCRNLLKGGIAPLGAIIYELDGPGYGLHAVLKNGPFREICRPIHPGRRLKSREFFNERARFWALAKEWLEEGGKKMPNDRVLRQQITSLRYEYRPTPDGGRKLLLEDKKQYKKRMALDPKNPQSGPSPDEADAWALGFAPVRMGRIIQAPDVGVLPDDMIPQTEDFVPLDAVIGY